MRRSWRAAVEARPRPSAALPAGATRGLQRAGYHGTGVDIAPQPRYVGDAFVQADAMTFPLEGYDLIWASPPCQGYTEMNAPGADRGRHPRYIRPMIQRLNRSGTAWALENVMGARSELPQAAVLCGSQFGLGAAHDGVSYQLQRHRLVKANFHFGRPECQHCGAVVGVYGGHARCRAASRGGRGTRDAWDHKKIASEAMGIDWMTLGELSEAIPPAYSLHVASFAPI